MNTLSSLTLAQIVRQNNKAATIFENHKLDFCCKGKRTLQEACVEDNIDTLEVEDELKKIFQSENELNPDLLTLNQLVNHIVDVHHTYTQRELPVIFEWLKKVSSKHGDHHPELVKIFELFTALRSELELHMQKEELILFPRINQLENQFQAGTQDINTDTSLINFPISMMEKEHENAGTILAEIRELTNQYQAPADACLTYQISFSALKAFEKDLHQHIHLENNILFPKAIDLLNTLKPSIY